MPDEDTLKKMLIKFGPLTMTFRADGSDYFINLKGKYNQPCDMKMEMDHQTLLVGWDRKYWILKHSYGDYDGWNAWGIHGYMYLNKKVASTCGLLGEGSAVHFPFLQ